MMEQTDKKTESEMETGFIWRCVRICLNNRMSGPGIYGLGPRVEGYKGL